MSRDDAKATEIEVAKLAAQLAADPRLRAEIHRARREFFGTDGKAPSVPGAASAAEHRFAEWFALERSSETLGDVPATVPPFAQAIDAIAGSIVGVFLVQTSAPDAVAARDLQDDTVLDLMVPLGSLQGGDLLVGRLFPRGAGQWTPSTACAVFRPGADLGLAFQRDVQRLDLERRLQQVELEHLLLRRPEQTKSPTAALDSKVVPLEHLEADLERLLEEAGSEFSASTISQQLAVAIRPGPVMGPLLDELAFDTSLDLDKLRALMVEIWNAHHAEDDEVDFGALPELPPAPGETLGERLVRTLDEGLAQKRDVEDLFRQLERMAGIEPEPAEDIVPAAAADGDDDDLAPPANRTRRSTDHDDDDDDEVAHLDDDEEDEQAAPSRPVDAAVFGDPRAGDLEPLIEEYLWETGRGEPAAGALRMWVELQANAPLPRTDLEQVTSSDLMRLLLHVYLGAEPQQRALAVQTTFAELHAFYGWAKATQELPLGPVLEQCRGALLDHVDRLQAASLTLSNDERPATRPGILQIEDLEERGFGVQDDDGGQHWVPAPATVTAQLQLGDLVLGALAPVRGGDATTRRFCGLVVVLPKDAKELIE